MLDIKCSYLYIMWYQQMYVYCAIAVPDQRIHVLKWPLPSYSDPNLSQHTPCHNIKHTEHRAVTRFRAWLAHWLCGGYWYSVSYQVCLLTFLHSPALKVNNPWIREVLLSLGITRSPTTQNILISCTSLTQLSVMSVRLWIHGKPESKSLNTTVCMVLERSSHAISTAE